MKERIAADGMTVVASTPVQFAEFLKRETRNTRASSRPRESRRSTSGLIEKFTPSARFRLPFRKAAAGTSTRFYTPGFAPTPKPCMLFQHSPPLQARSEASPCP